MSERANLGCGWNNSRGHNNYRSGCPYCTAVAGAVERERRIVAEVLEADLISDGARISRIREALGV